MQKPQRLLALALLLALAACGAKPPDPAQAPAPPTASAPATPAPPAATPAPTEGPADPAAAPQPATLDAAGAETPPEDGDRLVLTGTLDEYSYDDVAAMAENYPASDYERQANPTYWLIVLDGPQTIEVMSGGGPELVSGEASLIWVQEPAGLEPYTGQHITFSIDPGKTFWPSDVSLPVGGPRTNDVHILN